MKKKRFVALIKTAMRVTFTQGFIAIILTCSAYAKSADAQGVLNKEISLTIKQGEIKQALNEIQKQTNAKFIYSPSAIKADRRVSMNVSSKRLVEFLDEDLNALYIKYKIIDGRILLYYKDNINASVELAEGAEDFLRANITGTVSSSKGEPLPGVSIKVKGSTVGASTDVNGRFVINVTDPNAILVFTYIGFTTREVPLNGQTSLTVELTEESTALNEVVVIGYQTVQRKDLTGAVGVVNTTQVVRSTSNTVAEAIQGLAAGVTVRNTGAPGAAAKIDIRGTGTFGANNPLYVIDGMLADATPDFNPNDIESIQILKDASAAAIYGSRAANGVVIITTKQGREGPVSVDASVKTGIQEFRKRWDLMDNTEYAAFVQQMYANSGITAPAGVTTEYDPAANTDWQDEIMRAGSTQDYNLGLSGGGNNASYFISGNYFKNKGAIIDNDFERVSLRLNTNLKRGRVKLGENLSFSYVNQDPIVGDVFTDMLRMPPVLPLQSSRYVDAGQNPQGWASGSKSFINTFGNNVYAQQKLLKEDNSAYKIRGNAFAEVEVLKWLSYKYNFGIETSFDYYTGQQRPGIVRQGTPYARPTLNENRSLFLSFLNEHTLNFNKKFDKHSINGVVGISNQTFKRDPLNTTKIDIPNYSGEYYFSANQAGTPVVSGRTLKWASLGYLGRVNYNYADRYLISATIRRDGDSRFGEDYRWGTFPSISGAWRINQEPFFKSSLVSDLKLRASYGELGNSEVLGPWQYINVISAFPKYAFGGGGIDATPGAINIQLSNPDLHWETKKTTNIGADISFLNDRVSISGDYFISKTSDVLTSLPIPLTSGNASMDNNATDRNPPVNAASLKNTGFEVSATYRNNEHSFKWSATLNLTRIRNEVTELGNLGAGRNYIQLGDARTQIGRSIGEWYVLKTDGIFQNEQEVVDHKIQPNAKPGDIRYVDTDGNGTFDIDKDRTYSGSPWPKFEGGLLWNASYKNFSFSMQWYGVAGNKLYNRPLYTMDHFDPGELTNYRSGVSPWTSANRDTDLPRIGIIDDQHPDAGLTDNARPQTDRWLEDGSYLRLRNLEIGYTFPARLLNRIAFKSARVFINGQNLLTITSYKGLDPDITGANIFERGLDAGQYPSLRIYSVGLQFGL